MKILYDTNLEQIISKKYTSQPQGVVFADNHVELEVIERGNPPSFDIDTESIRHTIAVNLDLGADPQVKEYVEGWEVTPLTSEQIEQRTIGQFNWIDMSDQLLSTIVPSTIGTGNEETFYVRANKVSIPQNYTNLGLALEGRWSGRVIANDLNSPRRLQVVMQSVIDTLITPLLPIDKTELNSILTNNNFDFQIS